MTRQSNAEPFMASNLGEIFPLVAQGKVREIYKIDEETLLFVASDRISAYDVILDNGVPNKGVILTLISAYWFKFLKAALPTLQTHFIGLDLPHGIPTELRPKYQDRSMVVRKIKVFPIESIVRGYISGSAWKEYKESGTVNGISMPTGLVECGRLPTALWTPSTKADQGDHDINIHPRDAGKLIGQKYADQIQSVSVTLYNVAYAHAYSHGIIIADTKFEFGLDVETDQIVLIDEVLTPDSSRFWPVSKYQPGRSQESFDKQFLRDWLTSNGLAGKQGVSMPADIARKTELKYQEAFERITGDVFETGMPSVLEESALAE
ncbi:phosphoribosylaminoimidazole-succinocarboxamide synthase [Coccidioides immitis RS]|uniref:Phosphoribosylaminoimidazole-succinocarboxamide synthase n=3 Tax=Coccidioides TaxID=5500 RepID=A0A0E1RY36_COCIM|nr:phosphoribosylaminoimidazole-succinocarboxamide synthase [Coccidioides immitis RS]EAS35059.1 phosphoribosylaminoimidazole-succinocarboxamide synthase [Coccidioides immitis RS]KMP00274.1 phosphoribosylaminoimidazole-succinocarboxamide synthase [Coccidioides immitis RMSCC 2394]TPX26653.1 Bifunctional purine biosynthetic protein ade1 [Coccidioides immitis]